METKSIRCGHCKDYHDSVDEVRSCAHDEQEARWEAEADARADNAFATYLERRAGDGRYDWSDRDPDHY